MGGFCYRDDYFGVFLLILADTGSDHTHANQSFIIKVRSILYFKIMFSRRCTLLYSYGGTLRSQERSPEHVWPREARPITQ